MNDLLTVEQADFLKDYAVGDNIPENGVPIFVEVEGKDPVFLPDFVWTGGLGKFKADAPKGLWLGGGALMLYVPQGVVVIPDRRNGGNLGPAAQGWAKYCEGPDLMLATRREMQEELTLYLLGGEGDNLYQPCIEVVPFGVKPKGRVDSLNLNLDGAFTYGEVRHHDWCRNEVDRAWIHVGIWDLRGLPNGHRLRIIWDDDFPGGRRPGTNPRVLNFGTGRDVGGFHGLQGYLPSHLKYDSVMQGEANRRYPCFHD